MVARTPKHLGAGILVLLVLAAAACGPKATDEDPTPLDPTRDPVQTPLESTVPLTFAKGGFDWKLTPRASYDIQGMVLGVERYRYGWNAAISPCDVAMAWGALLQDDLYRRLSWSQSGRWYWWQYGRGWTRTDAWVARHSSNTHILPADENLARAAFSLHKGMLAELSGELVDVQGTKGASRVSWRTSVSRADLGDGSCEVLYLKRVKVKGLVYE